MGTRICGSGLSVLPARLLKPVALNLVDTVIAVAFNGWVVRPGDSRCRRQAHEAAASLDFGQAASRLADASRRTKKVQETLGGRVDRSFCEPVL